MFPEFCHIERAADLWLRNIALILLYFNSHIPEKGNSWGQQFIDTRKGAPHGDINSYITRKRTPRRDSNSYINRKRAALGQQGDLVRTAIRRYQNKGTSLGQQFIE